MKTWRVTFSDRFFLQNYFQTRTFSSSFFVKLVDAVDYLHRNHIAHQDIKDENLIINEKYHIKLIDFGFKFSSIKSFGLLRNSALVHFRFGYFNYST